MATKYTHDRPRFRDEWSFSGRGRLSWQRTRPQPKTGILEGDGPVTEDPVGPGEPRG